eukprot:TRINITY_DN2007_c0_g2_i1.p1 TRINITY_DN2007_c0_g2~~TRINITY_DN2007_c0_g2_i1.p1  ORF type:complete len:862 (-),score=299.17 TRINITY_DN2007_c0_g2_i1:205-2790(-)
MPVRAGTGVRPAPKRTGTLQKSSSALSIDRPRDDQSKSFESKILVSVRVRPTNEREKNPNFRNVISILDEHVLVFDEEGVVGAPVMKRGIPNNRQRARNQKFYFNHVFGEQVSSEEVYENTAKPLIPFVLNGFNATVFCYGATGSGKTHTMIGYAGDKGIMVQSMQELFAEVQAASDRRTFNVTMSYLEVYNEECYDLLSAEASNVPLKMLEGKGGKFDIHKLSRVELTTAQEVFDLLMAGNARRKQSPTEANQNSSRSHAILQVEITSKDRMGDISNAIKIGKLSLIDLAGSERACVSKNNGERQVEGANINRSLLALGNCISVLARAKGRAIHVPYRDSKLTRILKDSLGGNTRTVMIANVSPSSLAFEDTLNTLRYAGRATEIQTTATRNVQCVDSSIREYQQIIAQLRDENRKLQSTIDAGTAYSQQMDNKQLELNEAKQKLTSMETLMYQLREMCKEQYAVLQKHNLVSEKLYKEYVDVANKVSPGKQQTRPVAWAAASVERTSLTSMAADEKLVNKNFFREHDRLIGTTSSPPSSSPPRALPAVSSPVRPLDLGSSVGSESFSSSLSSSLKGAAVSSSSGKASYADIVKSSTPASNSTPSTPLDAPIDRKSRRLSSSSYILVEPARRTVPGVRPASEDGVQAVAAAAPRSTAPTAVHRPMRNLGAPQRMIDLHQSHPFGVPGTDTPRTAAQAMPPPSAKPAGIREADNNAPKGILKNRQEKPFYKHDRVAAAVQPQPAKKNARFDEPGNDDFQADPNAKAAIFAAKDSGSAPHQVRHSVAGHGGFMAPTRSSAARVGDIAVPPSRKRISMIEPNKENAQQHLQHAAFAYAKRQQQAGGKSSPQAATPSTSYVMGR